MKILSCSVEVLIKKHPRQAFPADWAMTMNNCALALNDRIRGERADNIEQAIEHYKLALQVRTRQAAPYDWAMTIHNLAAAVSSRIQFEFDDAEHDRWIILRRTNGTQARIIIGIGLNFIKDGRVEEPTSVVIEEPYRG